MTQNDLFYVASLIEFTARKTHNRVSTIAKLLGIEGIQHQLDFADVNHCLSFEQVSDELVEQYGIKNGTVDNVSQCKFNVPTPTAIGKVYMRLVVDLDENPNHWAQQLLDVLTSPISESISDFNSSFYFAPSGEILYYYQQARRKIG